LHIAGKACTELSGFPACILQLFPYTVAPVLQPVFYLMDPQLRTMFLVRGCRKDEIFIEGSNFQQQVSSWREGEKI
jgi:hypothetical protein